MKDAACTAQLPYKLTLILVVKPVEPASKFF